MPSEEYEWGCHLESAYHLQWLWFSLGYTFCQLLFDFLLLSCIQLLQMDASTVFNLVKIIVISHSCLISKFTDYLVSWEAYLSVNSLYHFLTHTSHVEPIYWFWNIQSKTNLKRIHSDAKWHKHMTLYITIAEEAQKAKRCIIGIWLRC